MCEITRSEFAAIKEMVERSDRTLRGDDGNPGLVTRVELIDQNVRWIRSRLSEGITWKWIVEKIAAPAVGVIIGVLISTL